MDSKNAEEIREILRLQFEGSAEFAKTKGESDRARRFTQLAESTEQLDPAILDAYSELFDSFIDSEVEQEMLSRVGISWFPASASDFVRHFIAANTGGKPA